MQIIAAKRRFGFSACLILICCSPFWHMQCPNRNYLYFLSIDPKLLYFYILAQTVVYYKPFFTVLHGYRTVRNSLDKVLCLAAGHWERRFARLAGGPPECQVSLSILQFTNRPAMSAGIFFWPSIAPCPGF